MNKNPLTRLSIIIALSLGASMQSKEIDLRMYEKRLMSAHGEDGILQKIFSLIESPLRYCVELYAGNGHFQSNSKYLRKKNGWKGLLLDKNHDNPAINLHKELINAENICVILQKYNTPHEFDLAIITQLGCELHVWKALSALYSPRVVVISFNNANMSALYELGRNLRYSLIYQESTAHHFFFMRDDIIIENQLSFKNINDLSLLHTGTTKNEAIS